jgi:hypothetical protein
MKEKSVIFIGILFLIFHQKILSQETRLNSKKVPEKVKEYIKINYPDVAKIKYYIEKEHDTVFIECEFKSGIDEYALRFFQNGTLYETEVLVKYKEIPGNISIKITEELNKQFKKYKILECFEVNPTTDALYEINVKGINSKSDGFYELFFDKAGTFIKMVEIIVKPISTMF